ncbi:MAG: hypothetical protein EOP88_19080 [Verrucomicrobiaceae bacterium]|nr:MAG: hypothetical protein EOP88_19080 [Verrucomicrobiaceae bacterium]
MKTHPASLSVKAALVLSSFTFFTAPLASADVIPQGGSGEFRGMYKIASSSDPIFPMGSGEEWFLDFGKGIQPGSSSSGSVAVSLRRNPNVKVRIMAWQYFPKQAQILIGNPYSEGSRNAVAKGAWTMSGAKNGVLFERGEFRVVLHRAEPADY